MGVTVFGGTPSSFSFVIIVVIIVVVIVIEGGNVTRSKLHSSSSSFKIIASICICMDFDIEPSVMLAGVLGNDGTVSHDRLRFVPSLAFIISVIIIVNSR